MVGVKENKMGCDIPAVLNSSSHVVEKVFPIIMLTEKASLSLVFAPSLKSFNLFIYENFSHLQDPKHC